MPRYPRTALQNEEGEGESAEETKGEGCLVEEEKESGASEADINATGG